MSHLIHMVGDRHCGDCGDLGDQFTSMTTSPKIELKPRGCLLPRDGAPCREGVSCPRCVELYGMDEGRKAPVATPAEDAQLKAECEWQIYRERRYRRDST